MENDNNSKPNCQDSVRMGIIYLITNLINGKKYVGQTRRTLSRRIIEHKRDSRRNRPGIDAAIAKYGWEKFKVEVVEECPVEMLNEREIYWIAFYDCKAPKGYNLTDGGDGGRGCSPSQKTRDKISAALKGRPAHNKGVPCSDETKLKLSRIQKAIGNVPPSWKGKKRQHSQATRDKISASLKARNERIRAEKASKALENIDE